jgi:hypothetical protein
MVGDSLICNWCEEDFTQKAKRKSKYCSKLCAVKSAYHKNKFGFRMTEKEAVAMRSEIHLCPICGNEYIKNRVDRETCSKSCSSLMWQRKNKDIKKSYNRKKEEVDKNTLSDILALLLDLKRKSFYINEIDIFKIISLWDVIYPNRELNKNTPHAALYERMITDLMLYYKRYK